MLENAVIVRWSLYLLQKCCLLRLRQMASLREVRAEPPFNPLLYQKKPFAEFFLKGQSIFDFQPNCGCLLVFRHADKV
jgi:hypothetical protein